MRALALLPLVAAIALTAAPASANGRFPAAGQIVVDPKDPAHIVARTTYGILTSRDAGANWDWICEQAVEYTGQFDPPMGITADGTVLAGVYDHLGVSHGDTCAWEHAGGLDQKDTVDVSTVKSDPKIAVALTSDALGGGMFASRVYRSPDNGASWAALAADLPADFQALTLDVSPTDPLRIYVSGVYAGGTKGAIERSSDGGATWTRFDVPGTDVDHTPFIGALDPTNVDTLYVRLFGTPGQLLVSKDGGATFTPVFTGKGTLKGFALSPDGATLAVGGDADGVWRAPAVTLTFEQASQGGVQCLAWSSVGLYACAGEFKSGFTIGLSTDQGSTFGPVMHLACLRGPLACAAGSSVGQTCPPAWPATADIIGQMPCGPDAGPMQDAGGGTGGGGGGAGGSPVDAGAPDAGGTSGGMQGGSGCRAARPAPDTAVVMLGLGALLAMASRRLRSRAE